MRPVHVRGLHATLRARLYTCPLPRASMSYRATTYTPALFRAFHPQPALRTFENDRNFDNGMPADESILADHVAPESTEFGRQELGQHDHDGSGAEISLEPADAGMVEVQAEPEAGELTEAVETAVVEPPVEDPYEFTYTIPPTSPYPDLPSNEIRTEPPPPTFFSHTLFRGPEGQSIKVDYCRTLEESESVAKEFLGEKVVGFDMEWKAQDAYTLKENVSLIQVATGDRVALFHVARHKGNTVRDIIAPSLKKLIESPKIIKTGVMVWRADGLRLRKFFLLRPQGFVEASHLHNLVEGKRLPNGTVRKAAVALAELTEMHLGWPLHKGDVRTSDWTRSLNQSQIDYAAADAYASFVLYQVLNNKRIAMDPPAPHPPFAELNMPVRAAYPGSTPSLGAEEDKEIEKRAKKREKESAKAAVKCAGELNREDSLLFEALKARRRLFYRHDNRPAWMIATDITLRTIASSRPKTTEELFTIYGMSGGQIERYGKGWLETVRSFDSEALTVKTLPPGAEEALCDMKFLFTGILEAISRDEAEELVRACGGEVMTEPDETTTYVVTGQDVSERKLETIATYNLPVLDERGFYSLIREKAAECMPMPDVDPAGANVGTDEATPQSNDTPLPPLDELLGGGSSGNRSPFLNALHGLRNRISMLSKLAPNVVASDSTLLAIAERKPKARSEMLKIPGTKTLESVANLCHIDLFEFVSKHTNPIAHRARKLPGKPTGPRIRTPPSEKPSFDSLVDFNGVDDMDFVDSGSIPDPNLAPPPGADELVVRPVISDSLGRRLETNRKPRGVVWSYGEFPPPPITRPRKF